MSQQVAHQSNTVDCIEGSSEPSTRVLAFYLPQFHPTDENDTFWGPGYTEWTSLARAGSLYRGHVQPKIPGELGFYDLRVAETRAAQAHLAREYGVHGFCYWHYWFDGRKVLERPLQLVVESGEPDFPFAVGWANHSWTRAWSGQPATHLIEQTYPGAEDDRRHFADLEPLFHDSRYIRVDGRPLLYLFRPAEIPCLAEFVDRWQNMATASGLPGIHFVGQYPTASAERSLVCASLDAVVDLPLLAPMPRGFRRVRSAIWHRTGKKLARGPRRLRYEELSETFPRLVPEAPSSYPAILPNWDCTPRRGRRGTVVEGDTPALFRTQVERAASLVAERSSDRRIVFLKSWNEWAEGNYVEPDWETGRQRLEALAAGIGYSPGLASAAPASAGAGSM